MKMSLDFLGYRLFRRLAVIILALVAGLVSANWMRWARTSAEEEFVNGREHGQGEILNLSRESRAVKPPPAEDYSIAMENYFADRTLPGALDRVRAAAFSLTAAELVPALEDLRRVGMDDEILRALFARWAELDPVAALAATAGADFNNHERMVARYAVWGAWAATDPDRALMELSGPLVKGYRKTAEEVFWRESAWSDPERALENASGIGDPEVRQKREDDIIDSLASTDPASALAWVLENREGEKRASLAAEVFWGWGFRDPQMALERLRGLPEDVQQNEVYAKLAGGATRKNISEALQLLPEIPEERQTAFLAEAIYQEATNNHNPGRASALIVDLPPGTTRNFAHRHLARKWAAMDSQQASEWVASLPVSPSRDHAAAALAMHLERSDPEAAALWATSIGDHAMRLSQTGRVIDTWFEVAPEAAALWLEDTDRFDAGEKVKLRALSQP